MFLGGEGWVVRDTYTNSNNIKQAIMILAKYRERKASIPRREKGTHRGRPVVKLAIC